MISFTVCNSRTFFDGPPEEIKKIHACLRIEDASALWKARYIAKKRVGYDAIAVNALAQKLAEKMKWLNFYEGNSFGTGLARIVKKALDGIPARWDFQEQGDLEYEIDQATFQVPKFHSGFELREEQIAALYAALKRHRGILACATNMGKTLCSVAIVAWLWDTLGRIPRTLFLVHRSGLAQQTAKSFHDHLNVPVGMLGGGQKSIQTITISTTQTAVRMLHQPRFKKFLGEIEVLFIDELHVNKADMVQTLSDHCEASIRIGLSGTVSKRPERLYPLIAMTGPVIHETRNKELVEKGHSAKPHMRIVRIFPEDAGICNGDYPESYRAAITDNSFRNGKVVEEASMYVRRGLRTLVTIQRLDHGRTLRELFAEEGLEAVFLEGRNSLEDRAEAKRAFTRKEIPVLIVSSIFDVGEDLPEIEAWVNAAGGKGWELVLQRLGRVLRKKEGDNTVYVSDFSDEHSEMMKKHSRARLKYYMDEKIAEIEVVQ